MPRSRPVSPTSATSSTSPSRLRPPDTRSLGSAAMPGATLSESDSQELLARFGVPFAPEQVVGAADGAAQAATDLGFPVVVKLNGDAIAHKTERGLVRLDLADADAVRDAGEQLLAKATAEDGEVGLLVAPMLRGNRELIAGLATDPQFGMTVLLGLGG